MGGYDDSQQLLSVWWADDDRFAALAQDGDERVLWECSVAADRCHESFVDKSGAMTLPEQ
jgi:hypothetical protein